MRILIVEDEIRLAENIATVLRESVGYAVDLIGNGQDGLYMAETNPYDLLILDLMLPGLSGTELLERMRAKGIPTPVLVMTARDDRESVIALLEAGADDYVTKPFDLGELVARCKALVRRGKGQSSSILRYGEIEIDATQQTVKKAGKAISLTGMEYRVLEYLAHRPGVIVSKTELSEHLYDFNWEKFSNVLEVYIYGLRRKLGDRGSDALIQTIRGRGYVLRG